MAIGVAFVHGWSWFRIQIPDERTHLIEYSVLAALIYLALSERARNGRRVPYPALLALLITVLLGWLDEGIQWLLPNHVYDIVDVGFNALAALMAVWAIVALNWARKRFGSGQ